MSFYRQPPFRSYGSGVRFGVPVLTPAVKAILIACGAVWVLSLALYTTAGIDLARWFGVVPQLVIRGFLWQPFTYMFLHDIRGISHLLFNMLILWMIGGELERYWGSRAFLRFYLVCGVGAGVLAALMGLMTAPPPGPLGPRLGPATIGASGAIYGLILAYGMIFSERILLFMFVFPMRARTMSWILFGIAFVSSLTGAGGGVSHIAHLGGMVIGYLYLKRAWRVGEFYRELKWKLRRRRFRVMPPEDDDRWVN